MKLPTLAAFTTLVLSGSAFAGWETITTADTFTTKTGETVEYGNGLTCKATATKETMSAVQAFFSGESNYRLSLTCIGEVQEDKPVTAIMWDGKTRLESVSVARSPRGGTWVAHSHTKPTHVTIVINDHTIKIPDMKDYNKYMTETASW